MGPRRRGAFTLMEVLATLVLIGLVLPVAMRGVAMSLNVAGRARHQIEAAQLAQQKVAHLLVVRDAGLFNSSGDFGDAWPDYRWQTTGAITDYGVYQVSVAVSWVERDVTQQVALHTLVFPATGLESAEDDATEETLQ